MCVHIVKHIQMLNKTIIVLAQQQNKLFPSCINDPIYALNIHMGSQTNDNIIYTYIYFLKCSTGVLFFIYTALAWRYWHGKCPMLTYKCSLCVPVYQHWNLETEIYYGLLLYKHMGFMVVDAWNKLIFRVLKICTAAMYTYFYCHSLNRSSIFYSIFISMIINIDCIIIHDT